MNNNHETQLVVVVVNAFFNSINRNEIDWLASLFVNSDGFSNSSSLSPTFIALFIQNLVWCQQVKVYFNQVIPISLIWLAVDEP